MYYHIIFNVKYEFFTLNQMKQQQNNRNGLDQDIYGYKKIKKQNNKQQQRQEDDLINDKLDFLTDNNISSQLTQKLYKNSNNKVKISTDNKRVKDLVNQIRDDDNLNMNIDLDLFGDIQEEQDNQDQFLKNIVEASKSQDENYRHQAIVLAYQALADPLHKYKSGQLPKILKFLPNTQFWAQMLRETQYFKYSPQAVEKVTKLMIYHLSEDECLIYDRDFLLPYCQNDCKKNKGKLSVSCFNALILAKYKLLAFTQGIIFTSCQQNLPSSLIKAINGVIHRVSMKKEYSEQLLLNLMQLPTQNMSVFAVIATILNKKIALSEQVLNQIVDFYEKAANKNIQNPLLYYDGLMRVVNIYGNGLKVEYLNKIYKICQEHPHQGGITEEIKRNVKYVSQQVKGINGIGGEINGLII